jgi:carbon monoxide dehydrogenase subunit G
MSRVTKVASIKANPSKVIDYIANVKNHPAFISALKSVENLHGDPKHTGENWDWTFVMGGVEIQGKAETADYSEGKHYSFKTNGGIESTFSYSAEPEAGGTRLTLDVSYEIPKNVLAKMVDKAVIERLNDQEGDRAVENLQAILGS